MNRLTCCLLAMFAIVGLVSARSHYATAYNQFRSLTAVLSSQPKAHVSCALEGNCLDLRNASAIPLVEHAGRQSHPVSRSLEVVDIEADIVLYLVEHDVSTIGEILVE